MSYFNRCPRCNHKMSARRPAVDGTIVCSFCGYRAASTEFARKATSLPGLRWREASHGPATELTNGIQYLPTSDE